MKYDREEKRIDVELSEFVGIARRKISSALPFDNDEPSAQMRVSARDTERLYYDFALCIDKAVPSVLRYHMISFTRN